MYVIKKDLTKQEFDITKVKIAINKSAYRVMSPLTDEQMNDVAKRVEVKAREIAGNTNEIPVATMHNLVELTLDDGYPEIAKSYRDYRNYKTSFVDMLDEVYQKSQSIMYIGDKENSNTDSALVSTKRSLIFNKLNKEFYRKFFLTTEMLQGCNDGYIYIHDMVARRDTYNCCIFDVKSVLENGFEMGNVWYNEPKTLDTAFDVIGDIVLSAASQQYGGFTISRLDEILDKYAQKSYHKYFWEIARNYVLLSTHDLSEEEIEDKIKDISDIKKAEIDGLAYAKVEREMMQGFQGFEYKFNTVASSRGDYPFITVTIGVGTSRFAKLATTCCLRVRRKGQGKPGFEKQVLFPKIVFTYTEDLHGSGKINEDLFEEGILCSSKGMYPDWLSLDGPTTISEMWHKYGEVIAPMGCVHGDSLITYRLNGGAEQNEPFWVLWNQMSHIFEPKHQKYQDYEKYGPDGFMYMTTEGLEVLDYDTQQEKLVWVKVHQLNRNTLTSGWVKITLSNGHSIQCTIDHPFHTTRGRIEALDLRVLDSIYSFSNPITVTNIEYIIDNTHPYTYDMTTESDTFLVNGMHSHNCRAFLSPWYERGGIHPADENDRPIFTGRFNLGAVSLHLPMILAKARKENKDFYEVLDYYLELIREVHKKTFDYLGEMRASVSPLAYCEGGLYGGHLQPHEKIKPMLKACTASYGITALNELNRLYNGKSIAEDGEFPLEVMKYINAKLAEFKKEDGILYAVYGTPAESLCGTQVIQFRKMYGIVENVSDKEYVSNSFHCHVSEDITGEEKQDLEYRFWDLFGGGRIGYVRYPIDYNLDAFRTYIRRAMEKGIYEGVNLALGYCDDCGYSFTTGAETCPKCGSGNLTKIDRMNG